MHELVELKEMMYLQTVGFWQKELAIRMKLFLNS